MKGQYATTIGGADGKPEVSGQRGRSWWGADLLWRGSSVGRCSRPGSVLTSSSGSGTAQGLAIALKIVFSLSLKGRVQDFFGKNV